MKQNYTITLSPETWQKLEDMAQDMGLLYRGRLSRAAVIEQLVLGQAAPVVPTSTKRWKLSEIVASWPERERSKWLQDEWKCKRWLQLALDTINEA